jgi:hypothetical protein
VGYRNIWSSLAEETSLRFFEAKALQSQTLQEFQYPHDKRMKKRYKNVN